MIRDINVNVYNMLQMRMRRYRFSTVVPQFAMDNYNKKQLETNTNFAGLAMSPTLRMNEMQNLMQSDGNDVYRFGLVNHHFQFQQKW